MSNETNNVLKEHGVEMFRSMVRIRRFEERAGELLDAGEIGGELHQYIGQEAVAVGICSALRADDRITSNHRGHGHLLAKGGDITKMMAELYGKQSGYCRGKGGSMHMTSLDLGIMGTNGIVGAGAPIAAGAGLAAKVLKTDRVSIAFFGDGGSAEGAVHEAMTLAAVWNLPVIFVCENNQYAISLKFDESSPVEDLSVKAAGYNMPGVIVDGMDPVAVYDAAKPLIERARAGEGPAFIEAKTYRFVGHFSVEDAVVSAPYRSDEEVEKWKQRDPLITLRKRLVEGGFASESDLDAIDQAAKDEVEAAVEFSRADDLPDVSEALEDAYATPNKFLPAKV